MTQQINLYDESLRPVRDLLTLPNLLWAMVASLVLLIGLAVFGIIRSGDEMRNFKAAEARLRQAQEQLTVFAAQQATRRQDAGLAVRLEDIKGQLIARQQILTRLTNGEFGDRSGFHGYFRGLALVAVDGLWLTGFDVGAAGRSLEIRGRMLSESALPRYVQALRGQASFAGREFGALNVRRPEADSSKSAEGAAASPPSLMEFTLSGTAIAEEKRP